MSIEPDQETLAEKDRQEKLLEIPGVKISDITVREYPLGEAAAHLVGYVQKRYGRRFRRTRRRGIYIEQCDWKKWNGRII